MDYAADKKASRLNDEYLFGRNILVKPVTDPLYTWKDKAKKGLGFLRSLGVHPTKAQKRQSTPF